MADSIILMMKPPAGAMSQLRQQPESIHEEEGNNQDVTSNDESQAHQ